MKAFISPIETAYSYDGTPLGARIVEVHPESFEIAPPFFWVDVDDDVTADGYYYDMDTQTVKAKPEDPDVAPYEVVIL